MIEYYESATRLNISFNKHIGTRGWQAAAHMMRKVKQKLSCHVSKHKLAVKIELACFYDLNTYHLFLRTLYNLNFNDRLSSKACFAHARMERSETGFVTPLRLFTAPVVLCHLSCVVPVKLWLRPSSGIGCSEKSWLRGPIVWGVFVGRNEQVLQAAVVVVQLDAEWTHLQDKPNVLVLTSPPNQNDMWFYPYWCCSDK